MKCVVLSVFAVLLPLFLISRGQPLTEDGQTLNTDLRVPEPGE